MEPQPPLGSAEVDLMEGGVSINVAARTPDLLPVLARALGCRVATDRHQVTLFLSRSIAAAVLACVEANGAIAVVFTRPSTHQTLKLKGTDARVQEVEPGDLPLVEAYRRRFAQDLSSIGYTPEFAAAVVPLMDDLVAVRFTPSAAFDQTPGPGAGKALGHSGCR